MEYIISTDTGGTFVDAIIIDARGTLSVGKHSSTPNDPAKEILGAVDSAARRLGISLSDALTGCKLFFNGTTVSTNAMIREAVDKGRNCSECGLCLSRCPYELPIPDLIKENLQWADAELDE